MGFPPIGHILPVDQVGPAILIVEDDPGSAALLQDALAGLGYQIMLAGDGLLALEMAGKHRPDLVILDWSLPGLDGIEVCRRLRAESDVPIIMVTAASTETDKVVGLTIGADDYVTKPFSVRELTARVQARLRSAAPRHGGKGHILKHRDLEMDIDAHRVFLGSTEITLTPVEFRLLRALLEAPQRVFPREDLIRCIYPNGESTVVDRTVDVHILNIRKKLRDAAERPTRIATVRGVGYKLV
jgi:DNA-binding response OmpR family regulator